jgi:hypothetical protein
VLLPPHFEGAPDLARYLPLVLSDTLAVELGLNGLGEPASIVEPARPISDDLERSRAWRGAAHG